MIPSFILQRLYSNGSLESLDDGIRFALKNRLSDAVVTKLKRVQINGAEVPLHDLSVEFTDGRSVRATDISRDNPVRFPLREIVKIRADGPSLNGGSHKISVAFDTSPFGNVAFTVEDALGEHGDLKRRMIPSNERDDYTPQIVRERQRFIEEFAGVSVDHLTRFSFDPSTTRGNIERFAGVAQVPIGLAGPLRVNGEHARGEFLIPMATTEGTLVASYNRGMKVLNLSGGVTVTVSEDRMQRAPVFLFPSAREARSFRDWIQENIDAIRTAAESSSRVAKLLDVETYLTSRMAYLRFNFTTGDAAGQNMVGKATLAACSWILARVESVESFFLESNFATDKKASQMNVLRTRGKQVTAEATVPREILKRHLRTDPETLQSQAQVATLGAFLSGAMNNGAHSANGITALFIATGQDVANVAESSAGIVYSEVTKDGDFYISLTLPSLIVATHGGGTGLATQRECLDMLGCRGPGKVRKLAEIVAGSALAGELSLGSAIASLDWVTSHEALGRNRGES